MGNIGQLFSRELGLSINKAVKIGNFKVPKKAVSYDRVTGTGSRGDFEVLTFRNKKGKIIKMGQSFVDEAGNSSHIVRNYGRRNGCLRINETRFKNGQEESFSSQVLMPIANTETKEFLGIFRRGQKIVNGKEIHSSEILRQGQKRKGIEYDCHWDGSPTEIRYNNIDKKLDVSDAEFQYLPFISADLSTKRVNQKFDLIQLINEKLYGMQGIIPKLKRVTFRELNPKQTPSSISPKSYVIYGEALPHTGQVRISDGFKKDSNLLISYLGHEFKHADDFVKMMQLYEPEILAKYSKQEIEQLYAQMEKAYPGTRAFEERCVQAKGYIYPGTEEFDTIKRLQKSLNDYSFTNQATHDAIELEVRANEAGNQQFNIFTGLRKRMDPLIYMD